MAIPVAIFILLLIDLGRYGADAKINVDDMNKLMLLFWIASASFIGTFPFLILPSLVASTDVLKDGLSGTNVLWQNTLNGNISKISVNKNGYVSVILSGTSYKSIVVSFSPT